MHCRNNVKKRLDSLLATHTIPSRLFLDGAALQFTFSKTSPTTPVGFLSSSFTRLQSV